MKEIPMVMQISRDDVEMFSHLLEMEDDGSFLKSFAERFLVSARDSSSGLRMTIDGIDSFNPYCMERGKN